MPTVTYQYNGGTSGSYDLYFTSPRYVNVQYGSMLVNTVKNSTTTISGRVYSLHHITVEMGGVDITENVVTVVANPEVGNIISYYISNITDDITIRFYIQNNPTATFNLIGCSFNYSSVTSLLWGQSVGESHGVLSANEHYDLHNAVVSVTMGEDDITSDVWANPPEDTTEINFNIEDVTGNVVINIEAVDMSRNPHFVTYNLTNCTSTNTDVLIYDGESYLTVLEKLSNYHFDNIEVTMGEFDITASVVNPDDGTISIREVKGDIVITASASLNTCSISYDLILTTSSNTATSIEYGQTYTTILAPLTPALQELFYIRVMMGNKDITKESYDYTLHTLTFVVTDDVQITGWSSQGAKFSITLYKNTAEPNVVDKTSYLTQYEKIAGCTMKEATSITNPSILLDKWSHVPFREINYVYIEMFKRYYFIEDVVSIRNDMTLLKLKVDVLMTYKDTIVQQYGYIGRNENSYDEYLVDSQLLLLNEPNIEVISESTIFTVDNIEQVLLDYYK